MEIELRDEDVRKVVPFRSGPHAVANAIQGARLVELDRRDTRRMEIRQLVETHQREIEKRRHLIEALWAEDELLEASLYG
jgi:hypothetical protein